MRGIITLGMAAVLVGCSTTPPPPPTLQSGPTAEVTVDGLVRVDNAVVPVAYRKPDMDLTGYKRFMLDPVEVAYKKDPGGRTSSMMTGGEGNFALTPRQMETFEGMFQEAVTDALTKDGGIELTTEPGPDVLRITASLIDLIVRVPTESGAARGNTFTRSYYEVSLILELRDSESGEILVRAADRRDPTRNTDVSMAQVSPTYVRADTERMFEYWANLLRERLDAFR